MPEQAPPASLVICLLFLVHLDISQLEARASIGSVVPLLLLVCLASGLVIYLLLLILTHPIVVGLLLVLLARNGKAQRINQEARNEHTSI